MASFNHNNRICTVCKIPYRYCFSCSEFSDTTKYPTWMAMFHDANCRSIFYTAYDYENGKITKEEARVRFNQCDLTNKENFTDSIKKSIKETSKNEFVKPVIDIVEEEAEAESEDIQKTAKIRSRKRGI